MATKRKPYKAKSLEAATRRVRLLQRQLDSYEQHCKDMRGDIVALAMLCANGLAFTNPIDAVRAMKIRDQWLRGCGLNPDGTEIQRGTP